jgi:hypothetical protein
MSGAAGRGRSRRPRLLSMRKADLPSAVPREPSLDGTRSGFSWPHIQQQSRLTAVCSGVPDRGRIAVFHDSPCPPVIARGRAPTFLP